MITTAATFVCYINYITIKSRTKFPPYRWANCVGENSETLYVLRFSNLDYIFAQPPIVLNEKRYIIYIKTKKN